MIQNPKQFKDFSGENTFLYYRSFDQCVFTKDLRKVKPGFKSVPLQIHFEISGLASAKKWCEIQNLVGEECF